MRASAGATARLSTLWYLLGRRSAQTMKEMGCGHVEHVVISLGVSEIGARIIHGHGEFEVDQYTGQRFSHWSASVQRMLQPTPCPFPRVVLSTLVGRHSSCARAFSFSTSPTASRSSAMRHFTQHQAFLASPECRGARVRQTSVS